MRSTRRRFLAGTAGLGLGAALEAGSASVARARTAAPGTGSADTVPFYGAHQAGITTTTQEHMQFGAFDVVSGSVNDLHTLLSRWTSAAAAITAGRPVGPMQTGSHPPVDTGESVGLSPARATVTFGIGPGIFRSSKGQDRFGLAHLRPAPLVDLPRFSTDALQGNISGGDLAVQVCADDPQVAFHALHDLIRLAAPIAVPRWVVAGFGRTGNVRGQATPRNLMGFKDGTANVMSQETGALKSYVWASGAPTWMQGGSYLVVRRIETILGTWDASSLDHQQNTIGRYKLSGAPLGQRHEHDPIDLSRQHDGSLVIPWNAHVRLASPGYNNQERILRRSYSYLDGIDPKTGAPAAGLLFLCYQRDPRAQFIPIQRRLAQYDALNRHTKHIGSAIFACAPGAQPGGFVGEGLFR